MQNTIELEISIQANAQQIYAAIADPLQLVKWFPTNIEGDYQAGCQPILTFGDVGKTQIHVVATEPYTYFAFRWVPGSNNFLGDVTKVANTLVEFRIYENTDGGCRVTMTESGFAELPNEMMTNAFKQNSSGWEYMMNRLDQLFAV